MRSSSASLLMQLRQEYHHALQDRVWGWDGAYPSNADKGSKVSVNIATAMLANGPNATNTPVKNQTAGVAFAELTMEFVGKAFLRLGHLRPGEWRYSTAQTKTGIIAFEQYAHLATIREMLEEHRENREFRAAFAIDYLIVPDIVIGREPVSDAAINANEQYVAEKDQAGNLSPLRAGNAESTTILHASIPCKWTIRSDRAQNTRTEALNLIRNRKGNTPHIVVVTAEPMPTRIASLALGAGDVDCVYHMAIYELRNALESLGDESQLDMLETLVTGRRLRDISDLPLDLAI